MKITKTPIGLLMVCLSLVALQTAGCNDPTPTDKTVASPGPAPSAERSANPEPATLDERLPDGHTPLLALAPPVDFLTPIPGARDRVGDAPLAPDPEASSRNLKRMTIPQLRNAISTTTDGLYWADDRGNDILEGLQPSLGVPDFIETTAEDLEPSMVFQKFLGDAARSVCDEAIQNDLEMEPSDRVMLRYADPEWTWDTSSEEQRDTIDRNLRYIKLRLTGHYTSADDEEGLRRLRWLWRSVTHATGSPAKGWRAACVGLMASPEFYLY